MSILIIGGAGYIGSHTVKYFLEQNEDIIVVDNLLTGHKEAILTDKFYNCDIRDKEKLDKVFKENNIECNPKYELATSNLIVDFAKRNFGIGAVVDKFAEEKINNKEIYKLDIKEKIEPRNICIIKKDKLISKASNELLKFIINK